MRKAAEDVYKRQPLRSIGEIMGSNVDWDDDTKTITLKGTKTTVTDADTFTGTKDKDLSLIHI